MTNDPDMHRGSEVNFSEKVKTSRMRRPESAHNSPLIFAPFAQNMTTSVSSTVTAPQPGLIDYRRQGQDTHRLGARCGFSDESMHAVKRNQDHQTRHSEGATLTIPTFTAAPRRQLADYTKQGRSIARLGSCAGFLGESLCQVKRESQAECSKSTNNDYTKQGRSITRLGSCARFLGKSLRQVKRESCAERSKSTNYDVQSNTSVRTMVETFNSISNDVEVHDPADGPEDDNETVEFFLKIPSRTSRRQRSSAVELREQFQRQRRSTKKGHSFIERLLIAPDARSRSAPDMCMFVPSPA